MAALAGLSLLTLGIAGPAAAQDLPGTTHDDLVARAEEAALAAAGGEELGGSVTILGVNSGPEGEALEEVFAPFEDATGVNINYQGSQDLQTVLHTRVSAGNPPDVAIDFVVGPMREFAAQGGLVALDSVLDMDTVRQQYNSDLLDAVTVDGSVYGIWSELDNYMIWHNPKAYDGPTAPADWAELQDWATAKSAETTPWCMGVESGANTGWPGATFVENLFLKANGPELTAQWANGELDWTSPEVRQAFEDFGAIATDPKMVLGGPTAVLGTFFVNSGVGLNTDPPQCYLLGFGNYTSAWILGQNEDLEPFEDLDYFPYPAADPAYSSAELVGGHVTYAFNDTPQVQAFMRYFASAEMQTLLASKGIWVMANNQVPMDVYPTGLLRKSAEDVQAAESLINGPDMLQRRAVSQAFNEAIVSYLQNPDSLDEILANMQAVQES